MHVSKHSIKAADGSVAFRSADEVNISNPSWTEHPPYHPEHTVTEFVTDQSEDVFIRVYNGDNIDGRWMIHIDEFNQFNNNAEAIRNALALPNLPTKYAKVTIPQGSNVRSGIVNPQTWEDGILLNGEALQFEILDNIDDTFIFTPLGDLN